MSAKLILDGYTLDATIPAKGPWPAVSIRYRPALYEEVMEYLAQVGRAPGKAQGKIAFAFLKEHLVGWDIQNAAGNAAEVSVENIARLPQPYVQAMIDQVIGYGEAQEAQDLKN